MCICISTNTRTKCGCHSKFWLLTVYFAELILLPLIKTKIKLGSTTSKKHKFWGIIINNFNSLRCNMNNVNLIVAVLNE